MSLPSIPKFSLEMPKTPLSGVSGKKGSLSPTSKKTKEIAVVLNESKETYSLRKSSLMDKIKKFFGFKVSLSTNEKQLQDKLKNVLREMKSSYEALYSKSEGSLVQNKDLKVMKNDIDAAKQALSKTRLGLVSGELKEMKRMQHLFETKVERDSLTNESTPEDKKRVFDKLKETIRDKATMINLIENDFVKLSEKDLQRLLNDIERDISDLNTLKNKLDSSSQKEAEKISRNVKSFIDKFIAKNSIPKQGFGQVTRDLVEEEDNEVEVGPGLHASTSTPLPRALTPEEKFSKIRIFLDKKTSGNDQTELEFAKQLLINAKEAQSLWINASPGSEFKKNCSVLKNEFISQIISRFNSFDIEHDKATKLVLLLEAIRLIGDETKSQPLVEKVTKIIPKTREKKISSLSEDVKAFMEADLLINIRSFFKKNRSGTIEERYNRLKESFSKEKQQEATDHAKHEIRRLLKRENQEGKYYTEQKIGERTFTFAQQFVSDFPRLDHYIAGSKEKAKMDDLLLLFAGLENGINMFAHLSNVAQQATAMDFVSDVSPAILQAGILSNFATEATILADLGYQSPLVVTCSDARSKFTWDVDTKDEEVTITVSSVVTFSPSPANMEGGVIPDNFYIPVVRTITIPFQDINKDSLKNDKVACPHMTIRDTYFAGTEHLQEALEKVDVASPNL